MNNKYWFWPKPDNVRFSMEEIKVLKRRQFNKLPGLILSYFIGTKDNFFKLEGGNDWSVRWDYPYDNTQMFISDFLKGKCAFVRESFVDFTTFLAKL